MSNIKYCIRIGILFLAGIIVFGCNEDRQNEKDSDIFQINIPLTSGDKPLFADSLFCGKEIVPLETTPECLISQIDKLEIADDKLYLLDDEQDFIFIFSRQGKFINKIDDIGRGPEEYYELSDFHIDDSLIYVTVGSGRNKVICYDLNGVYQKSFATGYPTQRITTDSNYIYVYYNFWNRNRYNVGVYDKKENRLVKCYKQFSKQQEGVGNNTRCWTSCNNKVYASFPYEYNIYELTPDTCRIIASIDYGKKYMFPEKWYTYSSQQTQDYIEKTGGFLNSPIVPDSRNLFVTSQRTVFSFIHNHNINLCIIENKTKDFQFGVPWPNKYYWNIHGSSPIYMTDEYMVNFIEASFLVSYREQEGKIPELTQEWELNIKEEDNPCLYFYKLKN